MRDIVPTNPFDALARTDMLQIVVVALLLGIALTTIPAARARPVLELCETLTDLFTQIVRWIIRTWTARR